MDGYSLARPLLFRLDPERAHGLGLRLMRFASTVPYEPLPTRTALGELTNPLGLAAGYDKTGAYVRGLSRLGFGYIVAGTFTRSPSPGNPKPRVARNIPEMTLVNSLGFPNPGVKAFVSSLAAGGPLGVPIVASISGRSTEDIEWAYSKVQPHVAGVELNLSSPNTKELRDLREPSAFKDLARAILSLKKRPTYLKTPPYSEGRFSETLENVKTWDSAGFEGVTASNSLMIADGRMAIGTGGYSGPPLLERTRTAVSKIRESTRPSFEINACGGVSGPADAASLLRLGATTVQVYTALVYHGPALIARILGDPEFRGASEERR